MPFPFPHEYRIDLNQTEGPLAVLKSENEPPLQGGPPVHFDGPGGVWSHETLLLGAIELCYLTTLNSLAKRQNVEFSEFRSAIRRYLDKTSEGIVFTRFELDVSFRTPSAYAEKLRTLLQSAKRYCIISNALKTEIKLNVDLTEED
jgi:organic hydroperoxide reductase OsmC/OhrA